MLVGCCAFIRGKGLKVLVMKEITMVAFAT